MNEMRRNVKKRPAVKKVFALLLALSMFCALLAGCDKKEETDNVAVRVGAMSGPTAMGMVKLMKDAEDGAAKNAYELQSFRPIRRPLWHRLQREISTLQRFHRIWLL